MNARLAVIGIPLVVGVLVASALLLHLAGLGWGRPFVYHPDEAALVNPAMDMVRDGSWNPRLFIYPSALMYIERVLIMGLHQIDPITLVRDVSGGYAGLPWRSNANALPEQFAYFYLGRLFVALVGALAVVPTYLAARMTSNAIGGIAAAAILAVAPIVVLNAHYFTADVPTAAMTATTLWLSLRGAKGGRPWLVAAGFAAGLAASTKYNGGLVVIVPLMVVLTTHPPRDWLRRATLATLGLISVASIVGFALLTPAVVFDLNAVWTGGILYQIQAYSAHPGAQGSDNFSYYLRVLSSPNGLGFAVSILVLLGIGLSIVRHRQLDLAVLSFPVAYFVLISLPAVRFDRNLLPMIPFLAVFGGNAVGWIADRATRLGPHGPSYRRSILAALAGVAVIAVAVTPSLSTAVASDEAFRRMDTRTEALAWIEANIPAGSTILREEFTPQVPIPTYRVGFAGYVIWQKPIAWYRSAGFEYAVLSSFDYNRYVGIEPQDSYYRSFLAQPTVLDLPPRPGQPGPRIVVVRIASP